MNLEYVFILLVIVGVFAYLIGYGRGASFTLNEFDRCFHEVLKKRKQP